MFLHQQSYIRLILFRPVHWYLILASVPAYSGQPYAIVNDNKPYFTDADLTAVSFETYSDLDSLGRCGVAYASVGKDLMLFRATVARRR